MSPINSQWLKQNDWSLDKIVFKEKYGKNMWIDFTRWEITIFTLWSTEANNDKKVWGVYYVMDGRIYFM